MTHDDLVKRLRARRRSDISGKNGFGEQYVPDEDCQEAADAIEQLSRPQVAEGELLPCPFCGGRASTRKIDARGFHVTWDVYCLNFECWCIAHIGALTEAEAIAAWNTRAPSSFNAGIEAAARCALLEELPASGEMPPEIIERIIAQDTVYVERALIAAVIATRKSIADRIRTLARPDSPTADAWQPIETAPKDGTEVLLYGRCGGYARGRHVGWMGNDGYWLTRDPTLTCDADAWQPLPAPPQPDREGDGR